MRSYIITILFSAFLCMVAMAALAQYGVPNLNPRVTACEEGIVTASNALGLAIGAVQTNVNTSSNYFESVRVNLTNLIYQGSNRTEAVRSELTNQVVIVSNMVGDLYLATNALNADMINVKAATNALNTRVGALEVPYQAWTVISPTNDDGSTGWCNIAYSSGPLVYLAATTDPTVVTFDNSTFTNYTNGVLRIPLEIWPDTNTVGFDTATITNESVTITKSQMNSVFFRRTSTNTVWVGRD